MANLTASDNVFDDDGWTAHGVRKLKIKPSTKAHHRKDRKKKRAVAEEEVPRLDISKLRGDSGVTKCSFPDGKPMKGAIGQRCMCTHCVSLRRDS